MYLNACYNLMLKTVVHLCYGCHAESHRVSLFTDFAVYNNSVHNNGSFIRMVHDPQACQSECFAVLMHSKKEPFFAR